MADRTVMLQRAARMRREPTEPEKRLWRYLSRSQLEGLKFRRQAILGQRIVDFFCPAKGLIVEIDGMTHDRQSDLKMDQRLRKATGFTTIRLTNDEVMTNMDGVLMHIAEVVRQLPDRWASAE